LTEAEQIRLASILEHSQRLQLAYQLKEEFRNIFETCHPVETGKVKLLLWLKKPEQFIVTLSLLFVITWMEFVITS
jgi:hypothetical protein